VDDLTISFAQEAVLRQIDECNSIADLKALAKSLVKSHYMSRRFIASLLLRDASLAPSLSAMNELDDELPWRQG
jgi:hypothetical protein